MAATPLGWPASYIAAAGVALLMLRRRKATPPLALATALAASCVLYGVGYLGVSVASDLRTTNGPCSLARWLARSSSPR
jgi:hypothetical protein